MFTKQSFWKIENTGKSKLVSLHWILNTASGICAVLGFIVIYYNKYLNNAPHFTSYHGLMGVISVIYSLCQLLAGFSLMYHSILVKYIKLKYKLLKKLHSISGCLAYLIGMSALILSIYSNWFVKNSNWFFIGISFGALYILVFSYIFTNVLNKNFNLSIKYLNF